MKKKRARASAPVPMVRNPKRWLVRALVIAAALGALGFAARSIFKKDGPDAKATDAGSASDDDPITTTKNGLVSVRYPSGFSATALDNATIEIDDDYLSMTVGAVMNPFTDDPSALAEQDLKLLRAKLSAEGATFDERSQKPTKCLGKYPGVETDEAVSVPDAEPTRLRGCFFVHQRVAVFVTWLVPQTKLKREQYAIDRILGSLEMHPMVVPNWDEMIATVLPNGLVTAHHPSAYAVKIKDDHTIELRAPDRTSVVLSAVTFGVHDDAGAFEGRWWSNVSKGGEGLIYREDRRGPGVCFGKHAGTQSDGTLLVGKDPAFTVRACFFSDGHHAYGTTIEYPIGQPEALSMLQKILDATEIAAE